MADGVDFLTVSLSFTVATPETLPKARIIFSRSSLLLTCPEIVTLSKTNFTTKSLVLTPRLPTIPSKTSVFCLFKSLASNFLISSVFSTLATSFFVKELAPAFFRNENSIRLVSRLVSYGLQLELSKEALANQTTLLAGDRIVVSGVFESISRNALKALIEANGGKVVSSISAKTTYLVAGANMGPSKRQKAEQLNVPILTEQEFLEKL